MILGTPGNDPNRQDGKKKPPGKTRQTLNYLFNPQLGESIRPIGQSWQMFLQLIAMLFAANRLFPRNHPALLGNQQVRLTLGEIITTAWSQLKFTRDGLPQVVLFFATIGTLVFTALMLITLLLSIFMGTAHAQGQPTPTNMFEITNRATDWSLGIINYLFQSNTNQSSNLPIYSVSATQSALIEALSYYSKAILVVASFMLLYHLLSMIGETAHTGKPFGRANQIWAPIRLVVAIGILVPLGNNGLNTGQYAVLKVTEWGAALANNTWNIFTNALTQQRLDYTPVRAPDVAATIADATKIYACMYAYNNQLDILSRSGVDFSGIKINTVQVDSNTTSLNSSISNASSSPNRSRDENRVSNLTCGSFQYPSPPNDYTTREQKVIGDAIFSAHRAAFASILPDVQNLAGKLCAYASMGTCGTFRSPDLEAPNLQELSDIIVKYQDKLDQDILSAQLNMNNSIRSVFAANRDLGWISAGVFFADIARRQGLIFDATLGGLPSFSQPNLFLRSDPNGVWKDRLPQLLGGVRVTNQRVTDIRTAEDKAQLSLTTVSDWADRARSYYSLNQQARQNTNLGRPVNLTVMEGNATIPSGMNQSGAIRWVLSQLEKALVNILPINWNTTTITGFQFNRTSNPLAELVSFGQAKINGGVNLIAWGIPLVFTANLMNSGVASILSALIGFFATILIIGGALIAFLVPLLPFLKFFFNVISWILGLFEAIVAIPLLALAHLDPKADNFLGNAKTGYVFIFNIFLRPVLMIFGFIAGLLIFMICISLLNAFYEYVVVRSTGYGGVYAFFTKVAFSVMYAVTAYVCANKCFNGISLFANQALRWMGENGQSFEKMGDEGALKGAVGLAGTYMLNNAVSGTLGGAAKMGDSGNKKLVEMGQKKGQEDGKAGKPANSGLLSSLTPYGKGYNTGYESGAEARESAETAKTRHQQLTDALTSGSMGETTTPSAAPYGTAAITPGAPSFVPPGTPAPAPPMIPPGTNGPGGSVAPYASPPPRTPPAGGGDPPLPPPPPADRRT
jgi:conjugal transfer/type IV secretion protein DotA/TraY